MDDNDRLAKSGFQHAIGLAGTLINVHKLENQTAKMHQLFNKSFGPIDQICDQDGGYQAGIAQVNIVDHVIFKTIKCKSFKPLELEKSREKIKEEALIDASYEKDGDLLLARQANILERASGQGLINIYGYKHYRSMKFYG